MTNLSSLPLENTLHNSNCALEIYSDLQFEDPRGVLPLIFKYFYLGEIEVTPTTIIPIIHFADVLLCTELASLAIKSLKHLISDFSVQISLMRETSSSPEPRDEGSPQCNVDVIILMLKDAVQFEKSGIVTDIINVLAPRFDEVGPLHDLTFLDYSLFTSLVTHPSIILESEYKLYQIISKYVTQKKHPDGRAISGVSLIEDSTLQTGRVLKSAAASKPNTRNTSYASLFSDQQPVQSHSTSSLPSFVHRDGFLASPEAISSGQITELYSFINWSKLSIEELDEAISSGVVPEHVLIKGLFNSLKSARGYSVKTIVRPTRKLRGIF